MKFQYQSKMMLLALLVFFVLNISILCASNQNLNELKANYEKKYQEYMQAVQSAENKIAAELAKELEIAKAKYEETLKALTIAEQAKSAISDAKDKIIDSLKDLKESLDGLGSNSAYSLPPNHLPGYASQQIDINGNNYCGQFSMSLVLNALGIPAQPQEVYKSSNPAGIFTAPTTIVEYLNMNGVDTSKKNNASIQDIQQKIDQGLPVMVLVSTEGGTPHWVTIFGYECNSKGRITSFTIRDSYWGVDAPYNMSIEQFLDLWQYPLGNGFASKFVDYHNLMIDIKGTKPKTTSPKLVNFNFSTATEDNVSNGLNDLVTGFKNFDLTRLASGVTKCVLGIPGAAINIASSGASALLDKFNSWRKLNLKKPGFVNKVANTVAATAVFCGKAATAIGKATGNLLSGVASIAGNLVSKLGHLFK